MQKLIQFFMILSLILLSNYSTVALSMESKSTNFIRLNPKNTYRFVDTSGKPFYPMGIGDCVGNYGSVLKYLGLDSKVVDLDPYLSAYRNAGFNLFRWSVGNCSFKLDSEKNWSEGDLLAAKLKEYGFRIQFVFFHNTSDTSTNGLAYVKKVIERYGDKIDIWEVSNESNDVNASLTLLADYIKKNDPHGHPVTTSFVYSYPPKVRDIAAMDITSPHFYTYADEFKIEKETYDNIIDWKRFGKPVIIGEYGYAIVNWDETTDLRNRLATWAAFFAEGSIVFWNTSSAKGYSNPNSVANAYLGEITRSFIKVLTDFTKEVPPDARIAKIEVNQPNLVRAYGLNSSSAYFAYLHAFTNHKNLTNGVSITIKPQAGGTATWIDPSSGKVLDTSKVSVATQTLTVPPFLIDVALKISDSPSAKK